jgi:hypothetical protein
MKKRVGRPLKGEIKLDHRISFRIPRHWTIVLPADLPDQFRSWMQKRFIDKEILSERIDDSH